MDGTQGELFADIENTLTASGSAAAYEGADTESRELASWSPLLRSASADTLEAWETLTARTRDLYRNDGHINNAIQVHLDNLIGARFRLSSKPDWRMLGIDQDAAYEWARQVESRFMAWAYDADNWIDASETLNFSGILCQGYRSFMQSGDILNVAEWIERPGARYRTCIKTVDPDRLSNQFDVMDTETLRGGIEFNEHGSPVRYHIRRGHPMDVGFGLANSFEWDVVDKRLPWGRRQVIHIFDQERPDQPRGISKIAAIVSQSRMLRKYSKATVEAAILNAAYAAVIESDLGQDSVEAALGMPADDKNPLHKYLGAVANFHKNGHVKVGDSKIAHLFPGEKLHFTSPQHPIAQFEQFHSAGLRHLAAGLNLSFEQFARDYTRTNYSGARAGWLEAWTFFRARRAQVPARQADQIYALWLEESISMGETPIPAGAPKFWEAKAAYCGSMWLGPGQGNIDPQKEENAAGMALDGDRATLEQYCADRGLDWEEVIQQRQRERKMLDAAGLGRQATATPVQPEIEEGDNPQ